MRRLLLVGAGHAHALLLNQLARQPLAGVEVIMLSPQPLAPYSGMVPGWLAGHYRFDDIVIDFPALAARAGADWKQGELHLLDPDQQKAVLTDGSVMPYDIVSLNVGSTLRPPPTEHAEILTLRPLADLRAGFEPLVQRWQTERSDAPCTLAAVGGGAAGFESLLAVVHRFRRMRPERIVRGELVTSGPEILPAMADRARAAALRALASAGISVKLDSAWGPRVDQDSDIVLWATGAQAHDWQCDVQRRGALSVDASGFVRIDERLMSVSHSTVFAVGDCASWCSHPLPKAGVHAVRMGPVLAANIRVALGGAGEFVRHQPQEQFLALLATGDGRAIASRGKLAAEGAWVWRWKDLIDRRFMRQFQS